MRQSPRLGSSLEDVRRTPNVSDQRDGERKTLLTTTDSLRAVACIRFVRPWLVVVVVHGEWLMPTGMGSDHEIGWNVADDTR